MLAPCMCSVSLPHSGCFNNAVGEAGVRKLDLTFHTGGKICCGKLGKNTTFAVDRKDIPFTKLFCIPFYWTVLNRFTVRFICTFNKIHFYSTNKYYTCYIFFWHVCESWSHKKYHVIMCWDTGVSNGSNHLKELPLCYCDCRKKLWDRRLFKMVFTQIYS